MKAKTTFLFAVAVAVFVNEATAECDKIPDDFNLESCCKFPSFGIEDTLAKVAGQLKDQKLNEYMMDCKVIEGLFKEFQWIKDNEIDKDAILKYTDGKIKDETWKSAMRSSIETCYKDIYAKKDEILKELAGPPFNISKDQCNGLFMSFTTCSQLEGFLNCPKDSWTDEKRCTSTKEWVKKCGDIDSMLQLQKRHGH